MGHTYRKTLFFCLPRARSSNVRETGEKDFYLCKCYVSLKAALLSTFTFFKYNYSCYELLINVMH